MQNGLITLPGPDAKDGCVSVLPPLGRESNAISSKVRSALSGRLDRGRVVYRIVDCLESTVREDPRNQPELHDAEARAGEGPRAPAVRPQNPARILKPTR